MDMAKRSQQKAIALQALEEHSESLMDYPNVVGIGLAHEGQGSRDSGGYVVKVYVNKKLSLAQLQPKEVIPSKLAVRLPDNPQEVVWIETRVEEIGDIQVESN
jgi:hypothetical protein